MRISIVLLCFCTGLCLSFPNAKRPAKNPVNMCHGDRLRQKGVDGSSLLSNGCPFAILGISRNGASKKVVLKAWRKKMKLFHSDKTGDGDDTAGKVLNDAKERALKDLTDTSMLSGDKAQQEYEELIGEKIDEDKMDHLWKILTGQTDLPDASNQAEQSECAEKWMNNDVFKQDIFRILSMTHGLY